jgi:hypothetical protein
MNMHFRGKSTVRLALAWTLLAMVPACQAQTANTAPNLDKHARKIHKRLTRYQSGSYIEVVLRDGSDRDGALGTMSPASFTITDSESNVRETHFYSEVSKVSPSKEYIGAGSGHHIRLWVPVVVGVVAAGAAMTAIEVR